MKKSLMLLIALTLVAVMTGCGGGGSSAKSKTANTSVDTTTEQAFDVAPDPADPVAQYKTTASGSFPPAPPSSSLSDAQAAANAKL